MVTITQKRVSVALETNIGSPLRNKKLSGKVSERKENFGI